MKGSETVDGFLSRLLSEYTPQLEAYGSCLQTFFPNAVIRLLVYSSAVGKWRAVER